MAKKGAKKEPDRYRTKEVAHIMDASPDDVILMCQQGQRTGKGPIPDAYKEGRYWYIPGKTVRKIIRSVAKAAA